MNPTQQATAAPVDDAPRVESIGEIVVFVDGYTDPTDIMEFAGVLAQEYDAHLTGVFMRPAPAVTPPEMFVRGTGIPNVIEARQAEVERIEADHRPGAGPSWSRPGAGSGHRALPGASRRARGGTTLVVRRRRRGTSSAVAGRRVRRRSPRHGRVWSRPPERIDIRRRHAHRPTR